VTAGDLGDDFAVGGRCVDAQGAAHVLAVERERGVLALDGDRGGAGLVRIVGKDLADEAAKQLLGVLAERGFDDDPLPRRQEPAILHGPPAVLVALGLEHQPRGARLVA